MEKAISGAINNWLKSLVSALMDGTMGLCQSVIDQIDQSLPIIRTWYIIFLAFSTSLVVVVTLGRIIMTLLKEADESTDATWANIIMDAIKSAAVIPIFVFLQGFVQASVVFPLLKFMMSSNAKYSAKSIMNTKAIPWPTAFQPPVLLLVFFGLIFMVITVVFFMKMCLYFADMAWYNLTIPLVAMSMATESFDYAGTWWKKFIYYNASIVSQVLCMSLSIWCFTHMTQYGFIAFIGALGFGSLVIKTPDIVKDFWASTGFTTGTGRLGMRGLSNLIRHFSTS